ncbi:hypothetical protein GZL_03533 [Streptomyces sp. 769]|nr:hypothetical protein GZL_03533 [Streptomyces sp. 769]
MSPVPAAAMRADRGTGERRTSGRTATLIHPRARGALRVVPAPDPQVAPGMRAPRAVARRPDLTVQRAA